jgi:hypothetical protein
MPHASPARWLAFLTAVAASAAMAQPVSPPAAAPMPAPAYRSAFEGYRPFTEDKPIAWRDANDTVRQRGGWKAYAAEAQEAGALQDPSPRQAEQAHRGHDADQAAQRRTATPASQTRHGNHSGQSSQSSQSGQSGHAAPAPKDQP